MNLLAEPVDSCPSNWKTEFGENMSESGFREKRKHKRYFVESPVRLRPVGHETWLDGHLTNLSQGGTCLTANYSFKVGKMVELVVEAGEKKREHRLLAAVMWASEGKCGLQFLG